MSSLVQRQMEQPVINPSRRRQPVPKATPKKRVTKGEKLIYSIALIGIVFSLYFVLSNYATIYVTNHQIQKSELEIHNQLSVNEGLQLQVMELSDPETILSKAKEMGMGLHNENVRFTHSNDN
ncbi:cell division protein FtsL [Evansella sp. AB-rgal1]|uniref:cell division protein FtsL n=1 Tax=Evansella sp. AB-rgal1 TaxID=3242696 RepID=UPI00359D7B7C